jgi:hypothetical protein
LTLYSAHYLSALFHAESVHGLSVAEVFHPFALSRAMTDAFSRRRQPDHSVSLFGSTILRFLAVLLPPVHAITSRSISSVLPLPRALLIPSPLARAESSPSSSPLRNQCSPRSRSICVCFPCACAPAPPTLVSLSRLDHRPNPPHASALQTRSATSSPPRTRRLTTAPPGLLRVLSLITRAQGSP